MTSMPQYTEANPNRQLLVGLIDALISAGVVIVLINIYRVDWFNGYLLRINSTLLVLLVFAIYRLLSLLLFGQTLGMWILQVFLLNGEEKPLTFLEKFLAAFFILYRGTDYYQVK